MNARVERIRSRLEGALSPIHLELVDDSAAHAGHAGALRSGGGHYSATIVAASFVGQTLVARHRMVYRALGDLMQTDIHAFSMKVYTPDEFQGFENS
ncbi:MAG: BolA family transcriptional regulator [Gammaproteobacteria bacterium]|nr:BolA family transcriptional regulator [Gammaproteobacteria bacterium]